MCRSKPYVLASMCMVRWFFWWLSWRQMSPRIFCQRSESISFIMCTRMQSKIARHNVYAARNATQGKLMIPLGTYRHTCIHTYIHGSCAQQDVCTVCSMRECVYVCIMREYMYVCMYVWCMYVRIMRACMLFVCMVCSMYVCMYVCMMPAAAGRWLLPGG